MSRSSKGVCLRFEELQTYPFFSFRKWQKLYDMNTNSHVFPEGFRQRPVWPTSAVPFAVWLEENAQVFREDLDSRRSIAMSERLLRCC